MKNDDVTDQELHKLRMSLGHEDVIAYHSVCGMQLLNHALTATVVVVKASISNYIPKI